MTSVWLVQDQNGYVIRAFRHAEVAKAYAASLAQKNSVTVVSVPFVEGDLGYKPFGE